MIKLKGLSREETLEIIPENTILLGYVGSTSHGTYIPKDDPLAIDDIDLLGVCFGPKSQYLGLKKFEQKEVKRGEWDSVVYEIKKFFSLLIKQNPNVLSLLWLNKEHYVYVSDIGNAILFNRDLFVSKQAYHSFSGYAHGQLHRMTHMAFEGYMGAKRKEIVKRFGFDVKNAAHLIRLLRMSIEYLTDGHLRVFRPDNDELKAIKRGEWSLERVKAEADRLFVLAQEAYVRSTLPDHIDHDKIEKLLMGLIWGYLRHDHPRLS